MNVTDEPIIENNVQNEINTLLGEIKDAQKVLVALGDENRQHLIIEMMQMGQCSGARVCEITERTHLSRPAVSHHLQILKDAGIVKMRREGTKNYYYFGTDSAAMDALIQMAEHIKAITAELPGRDK